MAEGSIDPLSPLFAEEVEEARLDLTNEDDYPMKYQRQKAGHPEAGLSDEG